MVRALSLTLLGGFEASLGDRPLPAIARKTQALLAYLALEGRAMHARSDLALLLWGDTGEDQAQQSLRKALSVLRATLGSEVEALLIQEGVVGLDRSTVIVDAVEFERVAKEKDPASLPAAISLYRGPLLAGMDMGEGPFSEWLHARRQRLRELALQAMSRSLDYQLTTNSLEPAIETAARLLELEPLHEPAHRALIRIYGRQGRRAAAARQYQLCVDSLERELGVKPEPETVAAYRASLEPAGPSVSTPKPPEPRPAASDHDPAPSPQTRDPLEEPPRESEPVPATATTAARNDAASVVSPRPAMRMGRWFAAAALLATIAAVTIFTLGRVRSTPSTTTPVARRSVVILPMKNLSGSPEQAWLTTALTETIGSELRASRQLRLVSAESITQTVQGLSPSLGLDRNRKQLDEIGRTLGSDLILTGDYLAVGGKIRVDVRLDDLATGETMVSASITDDQANLLAIVNRLGDELREGLHLAALGSVERNTLARVLPGVPSARRAYFLGLDALRLRDGPKAATLLQEAIAADPKFPLAHAALSTTWRLLGYDQRGKDEAKLAFDLAEGLSVEDRLNVEAHYYEASFNWAKAVEGFGALWRSYPDNIEYGLKLANVLQIATRLKESQAVIEEMRRLKAPDGVDPRIDLVDATVAERLGDYKRALDAAGRAVEKAEIAKASLLVARARLKQGIYMSRQSSPQQALDRFAESRALFESMGERGGVADALRWEGAILLDLGRREAAETKLEAALAIAQRLQYVRLTTEILLHQTTAARQRGALAAARASAEAAVASARDADEESAIARTTSVLGGVLKVQGDYASARSMYVESQTLQSKLGDLTGQMTTANNIAWLDIEQGRVKDAVTALEPVLSEERKIGNKARIATRLQNLSTAHALMGKLDEADNEATEECRLREELGAKPALASCRVRLALIQLEKGRVAEAKAVIDSVVVADLKATPQPPIDLTRLAFFRLATGDQKEAAAALAEADRVLKGREYIPEQAIPVEIMRARLEAAAGKKASALARLERARTNADRFGLLPLLLETRFVAAHLAAPGKERELLAFVDRDARAAGLSGLARRNSPARHPTT